ncbi:hypothetical protein PIIN_08956 [Serendipita indica DSM 11827]|uniref:Uncharacterized protein n=1 Tax=Serendipita indica (strain DSM 11827) TaxID=1109443 RepID=G4TUI3_SERID|nr:hypothetical protein PIIN_08956 [Serendipita indica DSM 11827]
MSTDMRPRSPRQDSSDLPPAKRQRRSGSFTGVAQEPTSYFAANLFENAPHLREQYESSQPFKHVVIDKLFQESLLMQVKDEVMQLSFTEKETDIYKVWGR